MSTTSELTRVLKKSRVSDVDSFLEDNSKKLIDSDNPFGEYMRSCIRGAGLKQQDVFIAADISEGYGYKLISGEKHTRDRDVLIRLCIAARLGLEGTQKALKLYGMAPLYPRVARDAVLIIAVNTGLKDVHEVNELLKEHGMEPLSEESDN